MFFKDAILPSRWKYFYGKTREKLQQSPHLLAATVLEMSQQYPKIAPGTKNAIKMAIIVFSSRVIGCIAMYI